MKLKEIIQYRLFLSRTAILYTRRIISKYGINWMLISHLLLRGKWTLVFSLPLDQRHGQIFCIIYHTEMEHTFRIMKPISIGITTLKAGINHTTSLDYTTCPWGLGIRSMTVTFLILSKSRKVRIHWKANDVWSQTTTSYHYLKRGEWTSPYYFKTL